MTKNINACCFTGNRPHKMPLLEDENNIMYGRLCDVLANEICRMVLCEIRAFFTGCADGVDIIAGEQVLSHKRAFPDDDIQLICAIPFREHERRWPEEKKKRLYRMLEQADKIVYVSEAYSKECYQVCNEYMVDRSEVAIAVHNGENGGGTYNTMRYAELQERELHIINPIRRECSVVFFKQLEECLRICPREDDLQGEYELRMLEARCLLSKLLQAENNRLLQGENIFDIFDTKYILRYQDWMKTVFESVRLKEKLNKRASLGFTKESQQLYELDGRILSLEHEMQRIIEQLECGGLHVFAEKLHNMADNLQNLIRKRNALQHRLVKD